jgi:hypothetical protein
VPRKTEWIHRVPAALATLEAIPAPVIDRSALSRALEISDRQALRILQAAGASRAGNSLIIDRQALIAWLKGVRGQDHVLYETRRRERLAEQLDQQRQIQRARQIVLPVEPAVRSQTMVGLGANIRLRPGVLEVQFTSAEDLLGSLFRLAQAASNDFLAFEAALACSEPQG